MILTADIETQAVATLMRTDPAYEVGLFGTLELRRASERGWALSLEGRQEVFESQDEACRYFLRRRRQVPDVRLRTQSGNTWVLDPDEEHRRGTVRDAAELLVRTRLENRIGFEFERQGGASRSIALAEVLRTKGKNRHSTQDRETAALTELFSWYIGYDCRIRFGSGSTGELMLRTLEEGRLAVSFRDPDRSFARLESALSFHRALRKARKPARIREGRAGNGKRSWIVEPDEIERLLSSPAEAAAAFVAARRALRRRRRAVFPPAPLPFLP